MDQTKLLKSKFSVPLILGLLILLFYGNTLQNGFVHDDLWQVQNNQSIKSFDKLGNIFGGCIAEEMLGGCKNIGFYWRPLQSVGYLITSQFSQSAKAFHFFNLIFFYLASLLVFWLFKLLKFKPILALIGAILFIVSPVNSEVVNWISATPELLLVGFTILSLIFFIKYLGKKRIKFLTFSVFSFFLSLLSKETAIFFVALLPLYSLIYSQKSKIQVSIKPLLWFLLPLGFYLLIRSSVLGRVIYKYEGFYGLDLNSQILTSIALFPKYLIKLIYPLPLSFQPQVMPKTGFDFEVLMGLSFLVGTLGLLYLFWIKKMWNSVFGLAIILLGIFPVLIFVNKLGEFIFSERYLLFSSIGMFLVIIEIVGLAFQPRVVKLKRILFGLFLVYLIFSFWIVFNRNKDWKDNLVSYQSMIRVDPNHKKAHLQLGELYKGMGRGDLAKEEYERALEIDPNYLEASISSQMVANFYNLNNLSFYYPSGWTVKEEEGILVLSPSLEKDPFRVLIQVENLNGSKNLDEYLSKQTETYGSLQNQGLAQIPNMDLSFVKLWEDQDIKKIQFFLFKGQKVVKILVSPADSKLMPQFDSILGTLKVQ